MVLINAQRWNVFSELWDLPLGLLASVAKLKLHLAGMKELIWTECALIWRWKQFAVQAEGGGRQDERDLGGGGILFSNKSFLFETSKLDISPLARFWHILFKGSLKPFKEKYQRKCFFFH